MTPAETADETAESRESGVEFISKASNYRHVVEPTRQVIAPATGDVVTRNGKAVQFKGNRLVTDDEDVIESLRESDYLNTEFWEKPEAPPAPSDTLKEVTRAAAEGDVDRLREIELTERNSHSRPEVLEIVREALDAHDAEPAEPEERPEFNVPRLRRVPATGAAVPPIDSPVPPRQTTDGNVGHIGAVSTDANDDEVERPESTPTDRDEEQNVPSDPAKNADDSYAQDNDQRPVPAIEGVEPSDQGEVPPEQNPGESDEE